MIDGDDDDLEDLVALSRQVWFDLEALEAFAWTQTPRPRSI